MLKREDNEMLTRVGPGTAMGDVFRRFWLPAMLPAELPGPDCDPVRLRLLGEDLVAFRDTNGRIGVLHEHCPHRRTSLFFGRNEHCGLRCVYHGWKFDVDGNCVDMPSEPPESNFRHKVRQAAYPAREHGGFIWVYMGQGEPPALPGFEWAGLAPECRWQSKWIYDANYFQGLEAELDSVHTAFLHASSTSDDLPENMALAAQIWDHAKLVRLTVQPTEYGFYYGSRRALGDDRYYWRITQFLLPSFAIIPMPAWPISCRAYIPVDDTSSMVFHTSYNPTAPLTAPQIAALEAGEGPAPKLLPGSFMPELNRANLYGLDRHVQRTRNFTGIRGVNNQDRAVVESMGAICDRTGEHLGTSDVAVIAARRRMLDLARQEATAGRIDPAAFDVRPIDIVTGDAELAAVMRRVMPMAHLSP
jgi:phenylpropionate dioxygenase-like ring-hydroxylating dioxygenase large terminal subunit